MKSNLYGYTLLNKNIDLNSFGCQTYTKFKMWIKQMFYTFNN